MLQPELVPSLEHFGSWKQIADQVLRTGRIKNFGDSARELEEKFSKRLPFYVTKEM